MEQEPGNLQQYPTWMTILHYFSQIILWKINLLVSKKTYI
jgi:hypothetical protein